MNTMLETITELSNRYGSDPSFVIAGGGNTSCKDRKTMWIKPSGTSLATITPSQFLPMSRQKLDGMFLAKYPAEAHAREQIVKQLTQDAVMPGHAGRPSVEAPMHNSFEQRYVVHTHPALVNGMTCAKNGEAVCRTLFPDAIWLPFIDPGFMLSAAVRKELVFYREKHKRNASMVFLQNHGVFVAADTPGEIDAIYARIVKTFQAAYRKAGVKTELQYGRLDGRTIMACAPKLRILASDGDRIAVTSSAPFAVAPEPLSPDHIVYTKSFPYRGAVTPAALDAFAKTKGYRPLVISRPGAVFACGSSLRNAMTAMIMAKDGAMVVQLSKAFGGPRYLDKRTRLFVENWELESYRKAISLARKKGRLEGKLAVVTGGAQGFGQGIAETLAAEGATVVVADMNLAGAQAVAAGICARQGSFTSFAVQVDVSNEKSVAAMMQQIVATCGGIDLFVSNAGVLRAGSVKTMALSDFDFVTRVNYTGYFLCVKHASAVMAAQNADGRGSLMDIVQVNSKSGLEGSNRNGAYAGGKFGAIGLTQSFAKELVADRIKVNAVCPGNYFEGPLWSDEKTGLFKQYLHAGKVPGAKSIADVKEYYESLVPMGRGCKPEDVARAIVYCVEQAYETGQAIPVTGGQVMLS